jgi:hypothetical protein
MCTHLQGLVTSDEAAAMLLEPELEASDLVPDKYEGQYEFHFRSMHQQRKGVAPGACRTSTS